MRIEVIARKRVSKFIVHQIWFLLCLIICYAHCVPPNKKKRSQKLRAERDFLGEIESDESLAGRQKEEVYDRTLSSNDQ